MPNHLSILGIFHTAVSILAIFAAIYALASHGKISPKKGTGRLYIMLTIVTCLTSLPIMKTGHFTGAHGLAIIVLLLLPIGIYANSFKILGKLGAYIQVVIMSATLFLSMIPAIVETTTRLPISHPLANGPGSPIVQMGLLALTSVYIVGVVYQLFRLKASRKNAETPHVTLT